MTTEPEIAGAILGIGRITSLPRSASSGENPAGRPPLPGAGPVVLRLVGMVAGPMCGVAGTLGGDVGTIGFETGDGPARCWTSRSARAGLWQPDEPAVGTVDGDFLDTEEATSSIPVPPTSISAGERPFLWISNRALWMIREADREHRRYQG